MKISLPSSHTYVQVVKIMGANQHKPQRVSLSISTDDEGKIYVVGDGKKLTVDNRYEFNLTTTDLFLMFIKALFGGESAELLEKK